MFKAGMKAKNKKQQRTTEQEFGQYAAWKTADSSASDKIQRRQGASSSTSKHNEKADFKRRLHNFDQKHHKQMSEKKEQELADLWWKFVTAKHHKRQDGTLPDHSNNKTMEEEMEQGITNPLWKKEDAEHQKCHGSGSACTGKETYEQQQKAMSKEMLHQFNQLERQAMEEEFAQKMADAWWNDVDHKHHKWQEGLFGDTNQGSGSIQSIEKQEKDAQRRMLNAQEKTIHAMQHGEKGTPKHDKGWWHTAKEAAGHIQKLFLFHCTSWSAIQPVLLGEHERAVMELRKEAG